MLSGGPRRFVFYEAYVQDKMLYFTNNKAILLSKEADTMPNIKPVSDLRNYNDVLRDVTVGEPVFLTKNGRGRYALIDISEYEKTKATIKLLSHLADGEKTGREKGWLTIDDVEKSLMV